MLPSVLLLVGAVAQPCLGAVANPFLQTVSRWTGEPGQPWAEQEILTVKAKLLQVFLHKATVSYLLLQHGTVIWYLARSTASS